MGFRPTRLDRDLLLAWREPPAVQSWDANTTILYNLAVGAGLLEEQEGLPFVWEKRLVTLPSMATILANGDPWTIDPRSTINAQHMVHGAQQLVLHRPLPVTGTVIGDTRVVQVWDNGPGRGAVLEMEKTLRLEGDDAPIATATAQIFCRADGGFGGPARPPAPPFELPARKPDYTASLATRADQALLYRLLGDRHDLHVDPAFARAAGFDRPIFHGLGSYGLACLLIVHAFCERAPDRIGRIDARFSAPVYPGDRLDLCLWDQGDGSADFVVQCGGRTVLDRGFVSLR